MITWMQKHKKWLVITIWISTIAFVGAGFVGWGSYEYGKSSGAVAVVGDRKVSVEEYQREYSGIYQQYAQAFGNQFNQEMAKKMKLHEAAINLVIQKNLILSYADDLGLNVTDEDIAKELVQMDAFIKDGKFDKELYIKVLRQNRTTAVEFEESLKRDLLLQKVESLFDLEPVNNEVSNLTEVLFSQDDISIKILNPNDIKIDLSDDKLKAYWEVNKVKYLSDKSYELSTTNIAFEKITPTTEELQDHYKKFKTDYKKEDGKIKSFDEAKDDMIRFLSAKATKKTALKEYLKLKKDESKFEKDITIFENELKFSQEEINEIKTANIGDVLKPFEGENSFTIVKVLNKIDPKPLAFEDAKQMVKADYESEEKEKEIENLANNELKNFKGLEIGFVGRESVNSITGLTPNEAYEFLNQLFMSSEKLGKISVADKIVLYKINASRLGTNNDEKLKVIKDTLLKLQKAELMNSLVKNLENKYEVSSSLDVKE